MHEHGANVKLQPDHKLVFKADWDEGIERLKGARALVRELADIASGKKEEAASGAVHELRIALPSKSIPTPAAATPQPKKPPLPKAPVMKTLHGVSYKGKDLKR
jgi:transcription-repair coupling factor (superfamily II helicase)